VLAEPLDPAVVRRLLRAILPAGDLVFSRHALDEMRKDDLTAPDVVNVLRGGAVQPGEFENGSWRYRVMTQRIAAVVAFRTETRAVVVTAWRIKR
jgi:uncharacterized protein DUF4258